MASGVIAGGMIPKVEESLAMLDEGIEAIHIVGIEPATSILDAARELTRSSGALLIIDEIQAGLGRTGKWCAYQHYNVQPDITTLAKPLAGGLPLGAMLCTDEVASAMQPGLHGTTFGGGPLACAVALQLLHTIEKQKLMKHAQNTGAYLLESLQHLQRQHQAIREVRGLGLMVGVELDSAETAKAVFRQMLERGVIVNRTDETVIRFLPPFVVQKLHIDQAIDELERALAANTTAGLALAAEKRGRE